MRRALRIASSVLAAAVSSQAAYHYVHYASSANFTPIYEKFNLAALPNNTVTFCVEDQGPSGYAVNDTFGSVLAQIRQALAAWNAISVTQLRVAYGGLESYTANPTVANALSGADTPIPGSNTPGADIIFVDTPGLLGMGAPTTSTVQAQGPNGPYYPIVRGLVMLSQNTANPSGPGPSYTEEYFTTAVHEIGHALGLQHTWTSSAMSQDVIRNTSRARPLDADDIASLAALYGNTNWQTNYGSISGRVTFAASGAGVALASVVAISPNGPAVSTLTNPDGTYVIQGLPPNFTYLVYAHPLPPDAVPADNSGLRLPMVGTDPTQSFAPNGTFGTVFNAGANVTLDPNAAASYPIAAAATTSSGVTPASNITNVNFSVQPNAGVPTYDVLTYSRIVSASRAYTWPGDTTISGYPAFMEPALGSGLVVAQAASPAVLPTPQSVTILGGFAPAPLNVNCTSLPAVCPYPGQPTMAIYFTLPAGSGYGPRHLVFNFGNDIYVLPSSVDLVQKGPPVVNSVTANADGTVTLLGAGFGPDSRVFFDGLQAGPAVFSGTGSQGTLVVTPPQASSGQLSTVTVYNSDGQNSNILQSAGPVTYSYPTTNAPQVAAVVPASLPAGMAASIDITTSNTNFSDGQVAVGFGTADVTVRRVWVLSPTHLIADAVAAPNAAAALSEVSIVSGMQFMSQPNGFQTQLPPAVSTPVIGLPILNVDPTQPSIFPGSYASIYGLNLGGPSSGVQVMLNGQPVTSFVTPDQINFQVPSNFATGPATLTLAGLAAAPPPVLVQVDKLAPVISAIDNSSGTAATSSTIFSGGDTLNVLATGLDPALTNGFQGRLKVTAGGFAMNVQQVTAAANGALNIQVVLTQSFGANPVPLVVVQDGSSSAPASVTVK